jgi:hypothetical protein
MSDSGKNLGSPVGDFLMGKLDDAARREGRLHSRVLSRLRCLGLSESHAREVVSQAREGNGLALAIVRRAFENRGHRK